MNSSSDITIVSTTDTPEQIQAALGAAPEAPAEKPAETPKAPDAPATDKPAAAAPEKPAEAATQPPAAAAETPAEQPPANETAEQKAERETASRRDKRVNKIQAQIDDLVAKRSDESRNLELTRAQREAEEARLTALRSERTRLESGGDPDRAPTQAETQPAQPQASPQPKAFEKAEPQLEDKDEHGNARYPNFEDWIKAHHAWSGEKTQFDVEQRLLADRAEREATERARIERDTVDRATQNALATYNEQLEEFKKSAPDFDAVVQDAEPAVLEIRRELGKDSLNIIDGFTIHDAENGPAMVHHLLTHTDEMKRIAQLPPRQQIAALGRLDARIGLESRQDAARTATGPSSVVAPVTQAPEPLKPVSSSPTAAVTPQDLDKLSYQEFKRVRNEQERAARR